MEIWIIRDGEKVGPLHDFEIRRKITAGELPRDTPAWHEGLGAWKPLVEIDLFAREFDQHDAPEETAPPVKVDPPSVETPLPSSLPGSPGCVRRFFARWLDLSFYSGVWWLGMWAAGQNIEAAMLNPWVMFFHYIPWFVLESVLIQRFATTPGKWLLGVRVLNLDHSHLELGPAIRRSMKVLFSGIGFGFSYLALFCHILSFVVVKRIGSTLWDQTGGHHVVATPLQPIRVMALVMGFFAAMMMHYVIFSPYLVENAGKENPAMKEYFEKNPPLALPKRH
jgi:uncharacterized RDD family membrane protein YckC